MKRKALNAKAKIAYLTRSYQAVDGLWFRLTEQRLGFSRTLAIDAAVWRVMPKIQARKLKELLKLKRGLAALAGAFAAKLALDGFAFTLRRRRAAVTVMITRCPWHDLLVKSGREKLAPAISARICGAEYRGWAKEFGPGIKFVPGPRLCRRGKTCVLRFVTGCGNCLPVH